MSKERANYKSTDSVVVVKVSPASYNGKYVATLKNHKGQVICHARPASDLRSSLRSTIDSVNSVLRESEKIIPLTKKAVR